MITLIEEEPGGEIEGILRVEISCPFTRRELRSLQFWFAECGWSIEVEQIDLFFAGEDWYG